MEEEVIDYEQADSRNEMTGHLISLAPISMLAVEEDEITVLLYPYLDIIFLKVLVPMPDCEVGCDAWRGPLFIL